MIKLFRNRKFKKLLRDPKLFFLDMYAKRVDPTGFSRTRSVSKSNSNSIVVGRGVNAPSDSKGRSRPTILEDSKVSRTSYTIVSAIYNVDKYLDDYFSSIVSQTNGFLDNIYIVAVDDGSTDKSAEKIKKWQKKYPKNIKYVYKENGGQASARNMGLAYVDSDWVAFVDPDDFLDVNYFSNFSTVIGNHKSKRLLMLVANTIFFREKSSAYSHTHPLKFRFESGIVVTKIGELGRNINLSASASIFNVEAIRSTGCEFDVRIRPTFEDAHFLNKFLSLSDGYVAFVPDSRYLYRKREDQSSSLDKAWSHPGLFDQVLEHGCLDLLKSSPNGAPKHLQWTVLYQICWYYKQLVNNSNIVAFLSADQIQRMHSLLRDVFRHIDEKTILDFNLAGVWFYHKVAWLGLYKGRNPSTQIGYIDDIDHQKKILKVRYFTPLVEAESITADGKFRACVYEKTIKHDFLGETFVLERHLWLRYGDLEGSAKLSAMLSGIPAKLSLPGANPKREVSLAAVLDAFASRRPPINTTNQPPIWIYMDRDVQADDNAEHFYRYAVKTEKSAQHYFVLDAGSHDWPRLSLEGFNLIPYGTVQHEALLKSASVIISSHADNYVVDYFKDGNLTKDKKFVFLQHGVIKDDLSRWLNSKKLDIFVTSSSAEYDSIVSSGNRYKFSEKEVVLSGLPRHDTLTGQKGAIDKTILIMPTWRNNIVGKNSLGSKRLLNEEFSNSEYARRWSEFLQSSELELLCRKFGYKVIFFPHANVQPYLHTFVAPEHVLKLSHEGASIQKLMTSSRILITDYSSVAFDFAYLQKSLIYYQFDQDDFYRGHSYEKGYFDYTNDGFGPVCLELGSLIDELTKVIEREQVDEQYRKRMLGFFPFRDGNNSQRVLEAIRNLYRPDFVPSPNIGSLHALIVWGDRRGDWNLVQEASEIYLQQDTFHNLRRTVAVLVRAAKANRRLRRHKAATDNLCEAHKIHDIQGNVIDGLDAELLARESQLLAIALEDWALTASLSERCASNDEILNHVLGLSMSNECAALKALMSRGLPDVVIPFIQVAIEFAEGAFDVVSQSEFFLLQSVNASPQILIVQIESFLKLGMSDSASRALVRYRKVAGGDAVYHRLTARVQYISGSYSDAAKSALTAFPGGVNSMPTNTLEVCLASFRLAGSLDTCRNSIAQLSHTMLDLDFVVRERAELAMIDSKWDEACLLWSHLYSADPNVNFKLATSLRAMGLTREALLVVKGVPKSDAKTPADLLLASELAYIERDYEYAEICFENLLRLFPNFETPKTISSLHSVRMLNSTNALRVAVNQLGTQNNAVIGEASLQT
ncbi:CDP-glycerol glycerophosphotransferase family protein [Schauerella aestuarii]|uniref:CDP-glycerol glycerophosphotransferase family protein n=1 Tax=Schauerella aestuarii TaxID=2511204 RepID=UPI00136F7E97|nr:CDP-glycerol glycerophosphotransferase family protein [Achromobacter aestuarii]MYZ45492.1 glycosyltransferase [Achromobacter aestuarii]